MAIAIFNDQDVLAGQKLGISTGKAIGLMVIAGGCASMNVYHMGNTLTTKLLTPDSSIFLFALIYFIALCIAFMEIPVTEEIVTQAARGRSAVGHRIMLLIVITMAAGAGLYSITSDADKRASTVTAHDTAGLSYQDRAQALISDRNIARSNATTTAERSKANADYYRALASLRLEQSTHQSSRPALAVKTDSVFHWVWAIGFSLLCSIGVVVITAYLTKYHKPLTEIPRVFFKTKEEQNWTMNDDDVRVIPAQVDLAGGSSTRAARKSLTNQVEPLPRHVENVDSNKHSSGDTENRPAPEDTTLGAVSNTQNDVGVRTPNDLTEKGGKVEYSESHYQQIKQGVISGDIKPTIRPVKSKLVSMKVKFVDDAARQQKAGEILDQLKSEGVILDNPDFGKGGQIVAKYILNSDYSEPSITNDDDEIGQYDLATRCPHCHSVNITDVLKIEARNGTVKCTDCGKGHIAQTHPYDSSQNYLELLEEAKRST